MTTYDGASYLSTNTPSEEEFKTSLETFLAETKTLLGGMTPTQLTISTDAITPRAARIPLRSSPAPPTIWPTSPPRTWRRGGCFCSGPRPRVRPLR